MLRALITYHCRCVTKMKQLSSKQEHEIAVADRLVKDLALRATFVRTGDPASNEPDVIYSCENQLLGIEVRHAYYSESFAKGCLGILLLLASFGLGGWVRSRTLGIGTTIRCGAWRGRRLRGFSSIYELLGEIMLKNCLTNR